MSSYFDEYYYENFPSDNEDDNLESKEVIENEQNFDEYCDTLNKTFDDMKKYSKNSQNPELLQYFNDYMELDTLFTDNKYNFSNNIIQIEKFKKNTIKDNIFIPDPINWPDKKDYTKNLISISTKNKKMLRKQNKQKKMLRKQRIKKNITENTKNILSSYFK